MISLDEYWQKQKEFVPLLIRFFMTVPPALLLSVKYDSWIYIAVTLLYLILPLFLKKPFPISERTLIYGCFVSILLATVPDFLGIVVPERFSYLDAVLRLHLLGPLLIYTACWGFCLKQEIKISSYIMMFCLLAVSLSGDNIVLLDIQKNTGFPGTNWLLEHYSGFYRVSAALVILGTVLFLTYDSQKYQIHGNTPGKILWTSLLKIVLLAVLPVMAIFGGDLLNQIGESVYHFS